LPLLLPTQHSPPEQTSQSPAQQTSGNDSNTTPILPRSVLDAPARTTKSRTMNQRRLHYAAVINRNCPDARAQLQTGHQDIFAVPFPSKYARKAMQHQQRVRSQLNVPLDMRQRFQSARTRLVTISRHSPVFPRHRRHNHVLELTSEPVAGLPLVRRTFLLE
jgi:hypothetical protein